MSGEHREPWEGTRGGYVLDRDGRAAADAPKKDRRDRIVSCVNACAGIPKPEGIQDVVRFLRERSLRPEFGDLLRALGLDPETGEEPTP